MEAVLPPSAPALREPEFAEEDSDSSNKNNSDSVPSGPPGAGAPGGESFPHVRVREERIGPDTKDPILDFLIEAGPRVFTPEMASKEVRFAIAKSSQLGPFREALQCLAQKQVALMHQLIGQVSRENAAIDWKSAGSHVPYFRVPQLMWDFFEAIYGEGCWQDEDFVEDTLKHHPGLRVVVKRGSKGQQYVNGRR
jgi:hypothetical protein